MKYFVKQTIISTLRSQLSDDVFSFAIVTERILSHEQD